METTTWRILIVSLLAVDGCAVRLPVCVPRPASTDTVYVISHGWHTDLALPASGLDGGLARFRSIFPGVRVLVVGFGRRTFLVAPVTTLADLLIGPLPGNGALQVLGLNASPIAAYDRGTVAVLHPTPDQLARLDAAIWASFRTDSAGAPLAIAPGRIPGSVFYASTLGYSGLYTCNTWTADMLREAGLPIAPDLDIFAGQTIALAAPIASGGLCRIGNR